MAEPRPAARANLWPFTWRKGGKKVALDAGTTVPTDADDGWSPGCLFIHTDPTDATIDGLYVNTGTAASCNFDPVDIALSDGTNKFISFTAGEVDGTILYADDTAPTTAAGYQAGALAWDTNAASVGLELLQNFGDATTADFDTVQLVRDITKTSTGMLVGGGNTVPVDNGAGWSANALFIYTAGATTVTRLYVNVGDEEACNFDATDLTV